MTLRDWSSDVCSSDLVSPTQLTVNAFEGLNPPPQALFLQSVCGESVAFSAAADVPWLSPTPTTGTIARSEERRVGKVGGSVRWPEEEKSRLRVTVTVM